MLLAVPLEADPDTTQPAPLLTGHGFAQWLDELAAGECRWEAVVAGLRDSLAANPEEGWELLALVDQYFRRHKISADDFHALNTHLQPMLLGGPQPQVIEPAQAPPAAAEPVNSRPRPLVPNEVLRNRYRIEGVLAHGGMGTVYAATDEFRLNHIEGGKRVALKILHTEVMQRPALVEELRAEFQHLQSLSHPNIVRVHEFDRDGELAFFTMEQLSGAPLSRVLAGYRDAPLRRAHALTIIRQVSAAVAYAHARGIVHGDLKPGNVFVTDEGQIRVLDFGAASWLQREMVPDIADHSRPAVATPSYSSCEVLLGGTATPGDDIYALACLSYVLLTGRHPYQGRTALQARAARLVPRRPSGLGLRRWRALRKGLRFDQDQRPAQLRTWLAQLHLPRRPKPLPPLLSVITPPPPRPSHKGWLTAVAVGVIAALSWIAFNRVDLIRASAAQLGVAATSLWRTQSTNPHAHTARIKRNAAAPAPVSQVSPPPAPATSQVAPVPPQAPAVPIQISGDATADIAPVARLEMATPTLNAEAHSSYATVIVHRRASYHGNVSFSWSTQAGTARPNQDFMPVSARLEFIPRGDRETRLLVPIVADPRRQAPKSFYVVIANPSDGAKLGSHQITLVTIPAAN